MAETTEISWATSTFNPWIGCTKVSPGCDNCYAKTLMDDRYGRVRWGAGEARVRTKTWDQPRRWNRLAAGDRAPWRVFCGSLCDVFDNEVPDDWREDLFDLIVATPALTWMLLTKRIGNVKRHMPANVWLGTTVVNQEEADRDIPKLLQVPARVRFLSCEPLLESLDLAPFMDRGAEYYGQREFEAIDWVIVGGESGANARAMDPEWARSIRDQCAAAGTSFFFKQWGGARPKSNGHLLDGREYREFPK